MVGADLLSFFLKAFPDFNEWDRGGTMQRCSVLANIVGIFHWQSEHLEIILDEHKLRCWSKQLGHEDLSNFSKLHLDRVSGS